MSISCNRCGSGTKPVIKMAGNGAGMVPSGECWVCTACFKSYFL